MYKIPYGPKMMIFSLKCPSENYIRLIHANCICRSLPILYHSLCVQACHVLSVNQCMHVIMSSWSRQCGKYSQSFITVFKYRIVSQALEQLCNLRLSQQREYSRVLDFFLVVLGCLLFYYYLWPLSC